MTGHIPNSIEYTKVQMPAQTMPYSAGMLVKQTWFIPNSLALMTVGYYALMFGPNYMYAQTRDSIPSDNSGVFE